MYRRAAIAVLLASTIAAVGWALWDKTPQQRSNSTPVAKATDVGTGLSPLYFRSRARSGLLVKVVGADEKLIPTGTVILSTHGNCTGVLVGERRLGTQR